MKIGIFGGTFNPPHIGHVRAAQEAAEALGLDKLIVFPSGDPPHKSLPTGTPGAEARLYMTQVAFEDINNATVSDFEIKNKGKRYTVDTIKSIITDYPGAQLYLLAGTDMFLTLDNWKDSETILSSVIPVVFSRETDNDSDNDSDNKLSNKSLITAYSKYLHEKFNVQACIIRNNITEISSSELRELLPKRGGIEYLAEKNYSYIIGERLYDAKSDWTWLRERAYSMLESKRIPHVAGCEESAVALAARWDINEDDAREAAILHDITKKLSFEEHRAILIENGFDPQDSEFAEEKLLHSKTGAILAAVEFGANESVSEAIKWHRSEERRVGKECRSRWSPYH